MRVRSWITVTEWIQHLPNGFRVLITITDRARFNTYFVDFLYYTVHKALLPLGLTLIYALHPDNSSVYFVQLKIFFYSLLAKLAGLNPREDTIIINIMFSRDLGHMSVIRQTFQLSLSSWMKTSRFR